jgi:hypothetical protein
MREGTPLNLVKSAVGGDNNRAVPAKPALSIPLRLTAHVCYGIFRRSGFRLAVEALNDLRVF